MLGLNNLRFTVWFCSLGNLQHQSLIGDGVNWRQQRCAIWRYLLTGYLAVLGLIVSVGALAKDSGNNYQLGRGYALGDTGIRLGGYASSHLESLGQVPWSLNISDLSLFLTWDNGSKLRFFSELEVEDVLTLGEHQGLTVKHAGFRLERLYLDYLVNDQLAVRVGKILTPVGQWNVVHADPLVWTATRPVATENLFSEHVTGIMLHGSVPVGGRYLDYSVYADHGSTLDPKHSETPLFDNALGVHLRYHIDDNLKLGFPMLILRCKIMLMSATIWWGWIWLGLTNALPSIAKLSTEKTAPTLKATRGKVMSKA